MRERDVEIAGKTTLWLTGLFAVAALPIPIVNLFRTEQIGLPTDLVVPYLFGTLSSFMAYVYGRLEMNSEQQERILNQPIQGVEVFHTAEAFLDKLVEITVGAERVSTLNLSPARGEHQNLDVYFRRLHQHMKSRRNGLRSFRSIASADSAQKLAFLVARTHELAPTGRASLAIFKQSTIGPLLHPLSIHITVKDGKVSVFLYPPVDMTGAMDSVLIRNEAVAKVLLDYFNILWQHSVLLNEGTRISLAGLDFMAAIDPSLHDNDQYRALRQVAQ